LRIHVLEPRLTVDESPNQPRAADPVDMDALAGDPGSAAHVPERRYVGSPLRIGGARRPELVLGGPEQVLELGPAGRAEVIDRDDLLQALAESHQRDLGLRVALGRNPPGLLFGLRERFDEASGELSSLHVVPLPSKPELLLDGIVCHAADEAGFAELRLAA